MQKSVQVLIAVMGVCVNAYSFQLPSPVDLFPLHKGFSFEYHKLYETAWYELVYLVKLDTDSGWVQCTVLDSAASGDTAIVWTISERARLFHRRWYGADHDTTYRTDDSTQLSLTESRAGNHPLSCAGLVWDFSFNDPSPIVTRYSDSASVTIIRQFEPRPPMDGRDTLCFSREKGFFRRACTLTIRGGMSNTAYRWQVDLIGATMVGVDQSSFVGGSFRLLQNYPNPFNPTTTIRYELPTEGVISLRVLDVLGRCVRDLFEGRQTSGLHQVEVNVSDFPTGTYFCQLQYGSKGQTRKMLLLK